MKCPKCGTNNHAGVKFCVNCGSSMGVYCSNCGTANLAGAKFCVGCGSQFGIPTPTQPPAPAQPVVVVQTGSSGWGWVFLGVLAGILIISGLVISGILPFGIISSKQALPTLQPVLESPEVSTEGVYCPQTGGVILYWNAGYDCSNDAGDPGYRLRYGDGFQDLNTGQFDNQASSIRIPPGWSVRLYENIEGNGASHCFNTSISNFEDFGKFDNRDLLINENVTSMQVFRDGTCGQDLAAGAEPAPMPEDMELGLDAPAGTACTDQNPCACLPQPLKDLQIEGGGFMNEDAFEKIFVDKSQPVWNTVDGKITTASILLKPEFHEIYESMKAANLKIIIGANWIKKRGDGTIYGGALETECKYWGNDLWCEGKYPEYVEVQPELGIHIAYESETMFSWCASVEFTDFVGGQGGGPGDTGQPKDCRDPLVSCPANSTCVQSKETGNYYCQENKQSDSSSGSGDANSSECTPGCWCEIGGVAGCWQDCASHCSDP